MSNPIFPIDPEALATALSRAADSDVDEPTAREIAWTAAYGPGTPQDALRILASARARRILTREWAQQCPTPDLLDTAIAPADADEDTALHAHAVRTLLTLHTRTCPTCTTHLQQLRDDLDDLDHELDQVEETVRSWAFTLTLTIGVTALARGENIAPIRQDLDNPDLYHTLTGRPRTETDRWPTITLTTTPGDEDTTGITARLLVPTGIRPGLTLTLILHLPPGDLRVPLTETEQDHLTLTGHATTPTWPADQLTLDIEVTPHDQP